MATLITAQQASRAQEEFKLEDVRRVVSMIDRAIKAHVATAANKDERQMMFKLKSESAITIQKVLEILQSAGYKSSFSDTSILEISWK